MKRTKLETPAERRQRTPTNSMFAAVEKSVERTIQEDILKTSTDQLRLLREIKGFTASFPCLFSPRSQGILQDNLNFTIDTRQEMNAQISEMKAVVVFSFIQIPFC